MRQATDAAVITPTNLFTTSPLQHASGRFYDDLVPGSELTGLRPGPPRWRGTGVCVSASTTISTDRGIDFGYPDWTSTNDREFVVVRPVRAYTDNVGQPFERRDIGHCYRQLRDAIYQAVDFSTFWGKPSDKGFRQFDPKQQFESRETLLRNADGLLNVSAVWLPDWDFAEHNHRFSTA
jgi:hypothetical protein